MGIKHKTKGAIQTVLSLNKTWYGIDLFKLIAAVLIVYLHTYNLDWGTPGLWVKQVLSTACVPFFFISSGFLFRRGLMRGGEKNGAWGETAWFKHYLARLLKIYFAWTLLTLPVAFLIVNRGHPDYGAALKVLYHFRLVFLTGSIGFYWYILALILSVIVVYWFHRKGQDRLLLGIATLLFLWGCLYNSPLNHRQPWFEILHVVFGSERSFLNTGLFYVLIGFLFPHRFFESRAGFRGWGALAFLTGAILVRTFETKYFHTNFTPALVAVGAFAVAMGFDFQKLSGISLEMRKLSIGLYLLHCPFILSFDFYLRKGTLLDFPLTLAFSIIVFYTLSRFAPRLSSVLFGYYPNRVKME